MLVKDDGKGFDVTKITENSISSGSDHLGGNGIRNMQARAEDMNATLCIYSINGGTTIQLTVPL